MSEALPADFVLSERRRAFCHGSARVLVDVDSDEGLDLLERIFPEYRLADPQPVDSAADLRLTGLGDGRFALEARGPLGGQEEYPCLSEAFGRLERYLADLLALGGSGLLVHAGGALVGGEAAVVAGPSGSGKSSLTTALGRLGHPVFGDDAVRIDQHGVVHPFKRLFKVHGGAQKQLGLGRGDPSLGRLFADAAFLHPDAFGSSWAAPAPLRHVVFSSLASPPQTLVPMTGAGGVRALLDLLLGPVDRPRALEQLAQLAEQTRFWRLRFDRCDRAAAQLERTILAT